MSSSDAPSPWILPTTMASLVKTKHSVLILTIAIGAGSVLCAACGGSPASGQQPNRSSPTTTSTGHTTNKEPTSGADDPTTSTTFYPPGSVVAPPVSSTTVPGEGNKHDIPVNQYTGAGNVILIKANGFWPQTLYANDEVAVTWYNLSGKPQKVHFDHIPVGSALIPPGYEYVWKPTFGGSLTYHSDSGFHALLVLQAPTPITTP